MPTMSQASVKRMMASRMMASRAVSVVAYHRITNHILLFFLSCTGKAAYTLP